MEDSMAAGTAGLLGAGENPPWLHLSPRGGPHLGPSWCWKRGGVGVAGRRGASEVAEVGRARPEATPWPHCPPPAGFADRPGRAGAAPSAPSLPPRAAPASATSQGQRLLLGRLRGSGARPAQHEPRPPSPEPRRPPSPGPGQSRGCGPRSALAGASRAPAPCPPPSTPQKESEETGRETPWQKFVNSGGLGEEVK